jgi:hypothetical protein
MTKTELKEAKERYFLQSKMIAKATSENIVKETASEQEKRIAYLLRPENYVEYFDFYYGVNSSMSLADAPSSKFHQSSYEAVYKDEFIRQFRRWFRGGAKSIHSNVGNTTHLKQNDMMNFLVLIGRNEGLAKILLSDLQAHLENNQRFINDFGKQISYGSWADGQFETTDGKNFKALGLNQPFRGLRFGADRPDLAIVDDVEDRDQAKNKDMVRKYGDKIVGDLTKAFHLRRGRLIIPNNYIVKDGINDYLLDKFSKSKHLDVSTVNLCDEKGNPSWDERYTKEDVIRIIEADDYYTSQREDFNNPIEEGKLFKADQIKKRHVHHRERFDGILIHWDLSYTSTGDTKAGCALGIKGINITVLETFCDRCSIPSAMEHHYAWVFKYKAMGYSPLSFYDATAAQQAVYAPIIEQAAEDNDCPDIPFPDNQQGDKHNRIATTILNALHRGILWWSDTLAGKLHDKYMDQFLSFEKGTAANDDAPDNIERGISLAQKFFGYSKVEGSSKPTIGKRSKKRRV